MILICFLSLSFCNWKKKAKYYWGPSCSISYIVSCVTAFRKAVTRAELVKKMYFLLGKQNVREYFINVCPVRDEPSFRQLHAPLRGSQCPSPSGQGIAFSPDRRPWNWDAVLWNAVQACLLSWTFFQTAASVCSQQGMVVSISGVCSGSGIFLGYCSSGWKLVNLLVIQLDVSVGQLALVWKWSYGI